MDTQTQTHMDTNTDTHTDMNTHTHKLTDGWGPAITCECPPPAGSLALLEGTHCLTPEACSGCCLCFYRVGVGKLILASSGMSHSQWSSPSPAKARFPSQHSLVHSLVVSVCSTYTHTHKKKQNWYPWYVVITGRALHVVLNYTTRVCVVDVALRRI